MKTATLCFILDRDVRILLGRKKRGFGREKMNGFGGKVEPGETLREAVLREVREETGLRLFAPALREAGTVTFVFPFEPRFDHHVHLFVTSVWEGEPRETAEMAPAWFPLDEIPFERMWADDPHWLPLVLAGKRIEATFTFAEDNETPSAWTVRELDGAASEISD
jgi:8-oxo-dGTP pyrophosphatase MutT (NUDIX family)